MDFSEKKLSILNRIKKRYPSFEIKFFLISFIGVSAILFFLALANEVSGGSTYTFDRDVLLFFRQPNNLGVPIGNQDITNAMRDITALGSGTFILLFTLILTIYLLLLKRYTTLSFLLLAIIGGVLIELGLKELFGRVRPTIVPHLMNERSMSFPSGHSFMATVIYLTIAAFLSRMMHNRKLKIYIVSCALFLTFIIGVSRVYLGVHYPTDVMAGWAIGLAWASFCLIILRFYNNRKRDKQNED